jgi:lysophospholipase L1-like esterase
VRAAGAVPVLVTPLTRRSFVGGKLQNDLVPWSDAIRAVAAELQVAVVDLNAASAAAVDAMGPTAGNRFAEVPPSAEVAAAAVAGTTISTPPVLLAVTPPPTDGPSGKVNLAFDYTHLGREGADYFAAMVTELLARAVPETRSVLIR